MDHQTLGQQHISDNPAPAKNSAMAILKILNINGTNHNLNSKIC